MIRAFIHAQQEQARIVNELATFIDTTERLPAELSRLIVRSHELVTEARKTREKK